MIDANSTILFLGEQNNPLYLWLEEQELRVIQTSEKINADIIKNHSVKFIISYGYRHIIKQSTLNALPDGESAINLHISYLPWNRGADPNLWSFIDNTPKGITIHLIDHGLDTGNILLQKEITFNNSGETLTSSYNYLQYCIQRLFKDNWHDIKHKRISSFTQLGIGSIHSAADKEKIQHLLTNGWETAIYKLETTNGFK